MVVEIASAMAIRQTIKRFIAERFLFTGDGSAIKDDESLIENGTVDSTGILELQLFVEESFGVAVDDEEVIPENFDSVSRLAAYVERKQRERQR